MNHKRAKIHRENVFIICDGEALRNMTQIQKLLKNMKSNLLNGIFFNLYGTEHHERSINYTTMGETKYVFISSIKMLLQKKILFSIARPKRKTVNEDNEEVRTRGAQVHRARGRKGHTPGDCNTLSFSD